jgi:hypothetical protein
MNYLGLHNKPKAAVHPELLLTGPLQKKKKKRRSQLHLLLVCSLSAGIGVLR